MKRKRSRVFLFFILTVLCASMALAAYHHEGERDSGNFLVTYPDKAGTKLDHCSLCHSGGQYEKNGKMVSMGSCQWCHYKYGYDASGNILETMNEYGKAYHDNGRNGAAITAIDSLDSDGDGYANGEEILANRFPGDPDDDPSKVTAPYRIYTREQLEAMPQHTQFLLMNTSRSGDFYAEYTGVPMEDLLKDAGILSSATEITVFAPDAWSSTYPLEKNPSPSLYHVNGLYPSAVFYYDPQADKALSQDGWCDYSAPSCAGRKNNDPIAVEGGLKMLLAFKREGAYMDPGFLTEENKLDGEGPFRVVPPQKTPTPPDQLSTAQNQSVIWPYAEDEDHNAGYSARTATIIRVDPLPQGTTDINVLEAGWNYVDQNKIIIYGAIDDTLVVNDNGTEVHVFYHAGQPIRLSAKAESGQKIWVFLEAPTLLPDNTVLARPSDAYCQEQGRYLFLFSADEGADLYYAESYAGDRIDLYISEFPAGAGEIIVTVKKRNSPDALETIQKIIMDEE